MDKRHLEELIAVENSYWWHVAKRHLVCGLLRQHFEPPGRLVEAGIGGGQNLSVFRELGYHVRGLDMMDEAVDHCRSALGLDVSVHDVCQPWPVEPESAQVVVMLDVLEHLEDPVAALRFAYQVSQPGGGLIFTVPAHPYLMGPWDRMLGHHRRYTPSLLREHARQAGFAVDFLSYWNSFSLAPATILRFGEKFFTVSRGAEVPKVPRWLNRLLLQLAGVERGVMKRVRIPTGLSLVGILRKRAGGESGGVPLDE